MKKNCDMKKRGTACGAALVTEEIAGQLWLRCPVCSTPHGRADLPDMLAGSPMGSGKISASRLEDAARYDRAFVGTYNNGASAGHDGIRDRE